MSGMDIDKSLLNQSFRPIKKGKKIFNDLCSKLNRGCAKPAGSYYTALHKNPNILPKFKA